MTLKLISIYVMSFFYIQIGIKHFTNSDWFMQIMPPYLPCHLELVYISGVFEIMLGILIIIPSSRRIASLGFILFLIIVYWANINMWINDIEIGESRLSQQGHVIRAIIQIILITIVAWIGKLKPLARN